MVTGLYEVKNEPVKFGSFVLVMVVLVAVVLSVVGHQRSCRAACRGS